MTFISNDVVIMSFGEEQVGVVRNTVSRLNPRPHSHPHAPRDQAGPAGTTTANQRPTAVLAAAGDLLRALAAPVRIAIVLELLESDRCVHELVEALGLAQPLISQHLRVLKSAGVVYGERHGREVVYRLVDEHLSHIVLDAVSHVEEGQVVSVDPEPAGFVVRAAAEAALRSPTGSHSAPVPTTRSSTPTSREAGDAI